MNCYYMTSSQFYCKRLLTRGSSSRSPTKLPVGIAFNGVVAVRDKPSHSISREKRGNTGIATNLNGRDGVMTNSSLVLQSPSGTKNDCWKINSASTKQVIGFRTLALGPRLLHRYTTPPLPSWPSPERFPAYPKFMIKLMSEKKGDRKLQGQ